MATSCNQETLVQAVSFPEGKADNTICSCKFEFERETLDAIKKAEGCRPLEKEEIRIQVRSHFKSFCHVHSQRPSWTD